MDGGHQKNLSIIIPSFNDLRILRAIESVRRFDDVGQASIVVVDGGSKPEVVAKIAEYLTADDILISEPDKGIFDALNKVLQRVRQRTLAGLDRTISYREKSRPAR